jgi:hydrogenase-4 membrane subunit HyfE
MQLLAVHQILIASAIVLAVLFGLRSLVLFVHEGGSPELLLAACSLALAGALGLYLRKVRARWLALKRDEER